MIDKFYWWAINIWYKVMYGDKIFDFHVYDKIYEKGDIIGSSHHLVVISNARKVYDGLFYKTISTRYQTTKREFYEALILLVVFGILVSSCYFIFK